MPDGAGSWGQQPLRTRRRGHSVFLMGTSCFHRWALVVAAAMRGSLAKQRLSHGTYLNLPLRDRVIG